MGLERAARLAFPACWLLLSVVMLATSGLPTSHGVTLVWFGLGMAAFAAGETPRRLPRLIRDWAPLVMILLVYDLLRGYADGLVFHAHELPQIRLDAWIFGKPIPTVWLQRHLWHGPHDLRWWDYACWVVYVTHFIATTCVAAALWTWRHDRFARFAAMVCGLAAAGYATYVLYPAAPPWMAAQQGNVGVANRIAPVVWAHVPVPEFDVVFRHGLHFANNVAAMPSLHEGYAVLLTLYLWRSTPRLARPVLALYPLAMAFALVYGAEHYVVDIVAGVVYATAVFCAVNWCFARRERPRADRGGANPPVPQ